MKRMINGSSSSWVSQINDRIISLLNDGKYIQVRQESEYDYYIEYAYIVDYIVKSGKVLFKLSPTDSELGEFLDLSDYKFAHLDYSYDDYDLIYLDIEPYIATFKLGNETYFIDQEGTFDEH